MSDREFEAAGKLAQYQWNPPKALSHIEPGNVIEIGFKDDPEPIRAIVLDRAIQTEFQTGTREFILQLMIEEPDDARIEVTDWDARAGLWGEPELRMRDPEEPDKEFSGQLSGEPIVLADTPAEYEGVDEEFDRIRMGSDTVLDLYQRYVSQFADNNDLDHRDIDSQWLVVEEEIEEMQSAFEQWRGEAEIPIADADLKEDLREEMIDVLFTIHLAGWMLGLDLRDAFVQKASYNLGKSGERDENGKIIDDAGGNDE